MRSNIRNLSDEQVCAMWRGTPRPVKALRPVALLWMAGQAAVFIFIVLAVAFALLATGVL